MLRLVILSFLFFSILTCSSKKKIQETKVESSQKVEDLEPANIEGLWRVKVVTPVGIHFPEMSLSQEGNVAKGDFSGNPVEIQILGDSVSFSSFRKTPLGKFNFDYTGNLIQADSMEGKFKMRGGPFANKIYDWGARKMEP